MSRKRRMKRKAELTPAKPKKRNPRKRKAAKPKRKKAAKTKGNGLAARAKNAVKEFATKVSGAVTK